MPQKLELTWYGKDEPMQIEPRLLIENAELSNCKPKSKTENMLIHGDNLLALKALESQYAGKVKCIYIDPPYNTGSAFEHYDDNLEHSIWLNLIKVRLEFIQRLISPDGFIFVQIDDCEQAYLKVVMDEIFGRNNFVCNFIWIGRAGKGGTASQIANQHEYILCYRKSEKAFLKKEQRVANKGNYQDSEGYYKREQLRQWGQGDRREDRPSMWYPVQAPDKTMVFPIKEDGTEGRWRVGESTYQELFNNNLIDFVMTDNGWRVYRKIRDGRVTETVYGTLLDQYGTSATATAELKQIFGAKTFDTPKPERLVSHLIHLASNPGDLVLDSFLGSGTTAAVAHKMGRRWIGIEMGDHAYSHCKVRLDKVIAGEDGGGITKDVQWQGGGEYRFFELAPSLINYDLMDQPIFNREYNAEMLAAAVALHEGYKYQPDDKVFWKQSVSNEKSWLFVTTRHVTVDFLSTIVSTMNEGEYLFVAARSFDSAAERAYKQITVKKIPEMLLKRCKFGKKDYNLNIVHPPVYEDEDEE